MKPTRRLLKYWNGPRCYRFWRWPRRKRSADIRDLGQASNAGQRPKAMQPFGREAEGAAGSVARSLQPATGDAPRSLLAIRHFCLYARPIPVFQQSPKLIAI